MKQPIPKSFTLNLLVSMVMVAFLMGCANVKDMEYRGVSNIGFGMMPKPNLSAEVHLFNPNNYAVRLKAATVEVMMDGKKAGEVAQQFDIEVPKKSEFTVPVQLTVSMRETGLLSVAAQLLSGKSSKVNFKGEIEVQVLGIRMKVPIDHNEEVRLGK